jgi:ComF family protein
MSAYNRFKQMHQWLLPATCTLCAEPMARERDFCVGCERSLPMLGASCMRCAIPLENGVGDELICGDCQQHPPSYLSVHAPFRYAAPLDRLIQGAKYSGRLDWVAILARQLAPRVLARAAQVDVLVPVPLHRSRLRERGYNQSLELARPLAGRFKLPLLNAVARVRATPPQITLSHEERRRNVRDAFAVDNDEVKDLRIALIDDVMTSGATVDAVARTLHKAGAASVEVWVVARA